MRVSRELYEDAKRWGMGNISLSDEGKLIVHGSVLIIMKNLTELPFDFESVSGDFTVAQNKLTSFKGFPKRVDGILDFGHNLISSWDDFPEKVGGLIYAQNNLFHELPQNIQALFFHIRNFQELTKEISERKMIKDKRDFIMGNLK